MKYILVSCLAVMLIGCSDEPRYLDGKTLRDNDGCAFIARHNVGDTLFLNYNKDLSNNGTCKYKEKEE